MALTAWLSSRFIPSARHFSQPRQTLLSRLVALESLLDFELLDEHLLVLKFDDVVLLVFPNVHSAFSDSDVNLSPEDVGLKLENDKRRMLVMGLMLM